MVVVVIITSLTALAIPSILKQMRDRRTRQTAEEVASIYRQARLRALGRGSAVLVRYASRRYQTLEAVVGGGTPNCVQLPSSSCLNATWSPPAPDSQVLSTWAPPAGITTTVYANDAGWSGKLTGADTQTLDVCFTPMGRTLARLDGSATFSIMSGVPVIRVAGEDPTRLKRYVLVPPNGLARTDVAE
jgi:type IV fimbrial biogenesis protein FimT